MKEESLASGARQSLGGFCPLCRTLMTGPKDVEVHGYLECSTCGLQVPLHPVSSGVVTNQIPTVPTARPSLLSRRQLGLLDLRDGDVVLDVGAGNGAFLSYVRARAASAVSVVGIEPDNSSRSAAERAGIPMRVDFSSDLRPNIITMWHAAEHIEPSVLVNGLRQVTNVGTRQLVLAVPNGSSRAFQKFGDRFAFDDRTAHVVQYTPPALDRLLREVQFRVKRWVWIAPYGLFSALQTTLNLSRPHNEMYRGLKRGEMRLTTRDFVASGIAILKHPFALGDMLLAETDAHRRAVLTVVAEPYA